MSVKRMCADPAGASVTLCREGATTTPDFANPPATLTRAVSSPFAPPPLHTHPQTKEPGNLIMQDTDDIKNKTTGEVIGTKLRYYLYGGSRGNYGEPRWRGTRRGGTGSGTSGLNTAVLVVSCSTVQPSLA